MIGLPTEAADAHRLTVTSRQEDAFGEPVLVGQLAAAIVGHCCVATLVGEAGSSVREERLEGWKVPAEQVAVAAASEFARSTRTGFVETRTGVLLITEESNGFRRAVWIVVSKTHPSILQEHRRPACCNGRAT
ncbi:hypothetical protein MINS_08220 [Mycolicibacterium insubricum]|nr:hypothetical protein MINS_08220 [Mycolicibacterium insubricum]